MGLPMFREPEVVHTKSALKADPSASTRSAIRRRDRVTRQHRPRHSPYSSLRGSLSRDLDVINHRRSSLDILRRDRENAAERIDRDIEIRNADLARAEASNRRRLENGRALLRDALSYEQPTARLRRSDTYNMSAEDLEEWRQERLDEEDFMRNPRDLGLHRDYPWPAMTPPPPPVETRDLDLSDLEWHPPARSARRASPPDYSQSLPLDPDHPSRRSPLAYSTSHRGAASFTPRFAPAYRAHNGTLTETREPDVVTAPSGGRPLRTLRDFYLSSSQPLPRPSENNHLDGLGDRRRSFTPEENQWETLLTTIPADEHLPSAESSFASASASATASGGAASTLSSNNSAASSSATLLTAPSSISSAPATTIPICDLESTDGEEGCSETEDDDFQAVHLREVPRHNNPYPQNPNLPSTARLINNRGSPNSHRRLPSPNRIPRRNRELQASESVDGPGRSIREAREAHESSRGDRIDIYARMRGYEGASTVSEARDAGREGGMVSPREAGAGASPRTRRREVELMHMHAILTRMDRREEVPEEWWANVGISSSSFGIGRRERL